MKASDCQYQLPFYMIKIRLNLKVIVVTGLFMSLHLAAFAQGPIPPIPGYSLLFEEKTSGAVSVPITEKVSKDLNGDKHFSQYEFGTGRNPSAIQIINNFSAYAQRQGGNMVFSNSTVGVYSLKKNNINVWIVTEVYENGKKYSLMVIQDKGGSGAESDLFSKISKDGHIAVYINFSNNQSMLPEDDVTKTAIKDILLLLNTHTELKLRIEGHTDNVGSPESNLALSDKRAQSVRAELIKQGIPPQRLTAVGKGSEKPIADNATDEGKEKNRRVELVKVN